MEESSMNIRNHALNKTRICFLVLLTMAIAVPVAGQNRPSEPKLQGEGTLKVMTFNTDVGTNYDGMLDRDLTKFKQAATLMVEAVRASDPAERAEAIARQIAATKPHLVSLQEVATLSTGTVKSNLTVEFDYQQLLLQALSAQGLQYVPVASYTTWDAIVPTTSGYARGTWTVVILSRADLAPEDFSFANSQGGTWTATFTAHLYALDSNPDCPVALRADGTCRMPWRRGWASTDVVYRGKRFRFIGAHLDSSSPLLEIPQGMELLNGPANTTLPVIVAADLNCDCSNTADPTYPTCVNFNNLGFADSWIAANPSVVGYTKYLPLANMRSDYVMVRGGFAVQAAVIVGNQAEDMTSSGLWSSDHAGVIARLQIAAGD
jgi:endonuclease/exonuclease/phosphatase family metal-dependent hydrolase